VGTQRDQEGMGAERIWPALVLVPALAAATATDLRARIVPDWLNLATATLALALALAFDPGSLPARVAAGAGAGAVLGGLALLRPDGMGMGDAKLAAAMGLCLAGQVAVALIIAFALGALAGAALIARHGTPARRRAIPFAPFLAAGGLLALAAGPDLLAWYPGTI
jgi:prepilin signal peptidase PulO-like enzyme (type II secretory pathway)